MSSLVRGNVIWNSKQSCLQVPFLSSLSDRLWSGSISCFWSECFFFFFIVSEIKIEQFLNSFWWHLGPDAFFSYYISTLSLLPQVHSTGNFRFLNSYLLPSVRQLCLCTVTLPGLSLHLTCLVKLFSSFKALFQHHVSRVLFQCPLEHPSWLPFCIERKVSSVVVLRHKKQTNKKTLGRQ